MPRRLAQQRMILNDLERPFHASRAISAVAELLVQILDKMLNAHIQCNISVVTECRI